jgi:rhamnose transport system permease protein
MSDSATRTYADYAKPLWRRALFSRESAIIALLVAVLLWAIYGVAYFGSQLTMTYLFLDIAPILLIALPMTLIIVTGEIDLSVASVLGLSSVLLGVLVDHGTAVPLAALIAMLAGLACGALNGFLIAYVGLPSLAVTIGTLALFRGIAVGVLGTKAITSFPERWSSLAKAEVGSTGVPVIVIAFVVLAIVFTLLLHFSVFGRGIYDIGLNAEAAEFTGVPVRRTKFTLFLLSGVVSAFAGVYFTLRFTSSRGDNALGLELQVIAAVLLGGVSIFGGRGKLHGVIAGVLLIGVISSALRLQGVTVNVVNIIIGLLLVASVMSTSVLAWFSEVAARRNNRGERPQLAPAGVGNQER